MSILRRSAFIIYRFTFSLCRRFEEDPSILAAGGHGLGCYRVNATTHVLNGFVRHNWELNHPATLPGCAPRLALLSLVLRVGGPVTVGTTLLAGYSGELVILYACEICAWSCRIDKNSCKQPCRVGKEWCGGHQAISVYNTGVVVPQRKAVKRVDKQVRIVFILTISGRMTRSLLGDLIR